MKKRIFLWLVLAVALLFCACQADLPKENIQTVAPAPSVGVSEPIETNPTDPSATPVITSREAFSDNVAWIKYEENSDSYYALIDTSGNSLVHFGAKDKFPEPFSGGYAFIDDWSDSITNYPVYIIDNKGNLCSSYLHSSRIVCRDSGYYVTEEDVSDFASKGYKYVIYDPYGKAIETFQLEDEISVGNLGKGVFYFRGKGYYCAQGKRWYDDSTLDYEKNDVFSDPDADAIVIGYNADELWNSCELVALTPKGTVKTAHVDLDPRILYFSNVVNDICLCYNSDWEWVFALHFDTGKVYQLDAYYSDRVGDFNIPMITAHGDNIMIPVIGEDKKHYILITDSMLKPVCDPIMIKGPLGRGDGLTVVGNDVYASDGKKVFSLNELRYSNSNYNETELYSCGYIKVWKYGTKEKETAYLDATGQELEIDLACGKELVLQKP